MSTSVSSNRLAPRLQDWLRPQLRWITLPSWVLSAMLHVGLAAALFVLAQLPSCQSDIAGNDGESFREVGIRLRPSPLPDPEQTHTDPTPVRSTVTAEVTESTDTPETPSLTAAPPVALQLPQMDSPRPLIGAASARPFSETSFADLIKPRVGEPEAGSPATGAGPSGGTSFLGVSDVGKRFVYVIDRSFSMLNDNALQAAKIELLNSLQRFDETQRFQIIFYNNTYVVLKTRDERYDMFWGNDAQRLQVSDQVRALDAAGGTRHLPALLKALEFNPDVIFLLTDGAAESSLSASELAEIKRRNGGQARIHCIEFGRGRRIRATDGTDPGNFLIRLASDNGGKYVYRDVASLKPTF